MRVNRPFSDDYNDPVHDLTKGQKRALRAAAELAHQRDVKTPLEDRDVHFLEARNADLPIVIAAAIADGLLKEEEVGEAARELVANVAAHIREFRERVASEPPLEEPDPYTPDAVVSLGKIVDEMELVSDQMTLYLNRVTGELVLLTEEELEEAEESPDEEDLAEMPAWQREERTRTAAVVESEDWIAMPSRFDLDEHRAMTKFAMRQRPSVCKRLDEALHGRGAFRRFRDEMHRSGLEAAWDEFRREWLARIVRDDLEDNGIPFRR